MLREPHERPAAFSRRDAIRLVGAVLLIVLALAAGVAPNLAPSTPGYAAGSIAQSAIVAPRDATITNPIETAAAQDAAAKAVPPVYDYTLTRAQSIAAVQVAELQLDLKPVDAAFAPSVAPEARQAALQLALPSLSAENRTILQALDPTRWPVVERAAESALSAGEQVEIRDTDLAAEQPTLAAQYMPTGLNLSSSEQQLAAAIATPLFVANSAYSPALTQQARTAAAAAVAPIQDTVQAGQVIVDQGHLISTADMVKIHYFGLDASTVDLGKAAAWMLLGTIVAALLLGWLWRFRPEYWHRTPTLVLIGLIFVVAVLALKLPGGRAWLPYLMPTAAAGMLLTLLLDSGLGIVMVALLAVLAGPVSGSSVELSAYVFLGGFAGILAIRKGERQHFFVQAGLAVAIADAAVVGTFALLGQHDMTGTLELGGAALGGALLSTVITLGSFSLLGNAFGILTPSQLLELANPSQPLLRRLLIETPGTYHHALMVGNLAERAASSIGADPLLARAAAYYHDIGKLANPLAFIENQAGGENIHDQLQPEDSATILKQHVADGIDLAYKGGLPKPLIAFIPQHHGTAILGFVYGKAREAAAKPFGGESTAAGKAAAEAVDQRRFRHAGPKPQSREAAILMLSDGVEASVRSLSSRDEATIRAMVSQIIQERMTDGQLDECDLTIRDLEKIRESFVGQLLGMYHQRIAYPQNKVVELESRRERGLG
ncbi:MAG: HD family phosphohydrolase [Candidatus Limnocylindrales bacterium]